MKISTLLRSTPHRTFLVVASLFGILLLGVNTSAADTNTSFGAQSFIYVTQGTVDTNSTKGVALYWDTFAKKSFKATENTSQISISARANVCDGGPEMVVYVDGKRVSSQEVSSSDYKQYDTNLSLAKNTYHRITISFLNDYTTIKNGVKCDRNLYLEKVTLTNTTTPISSTPPTTNPPTPNNPTPVSTSNGLYVDPYKSTYVYTYSKEQRFVDWRKNNTIKAAALKKIADQPQAVWLGYSGDNTVIARTISDSVSKKQTPVFVLYNIPNRDNGQYASAGGGAKDTAAYKAWIDGISSKIGTQPTIIILEPDALGHGITGVYRKDSLLYATTKLSTLKNTKVYLDATNSAWYGSSDTGIKTIAGRLKEVGVDKITGFSTNTANFNSTEKEVAFGRKLSALVGNKSFVVDTSRNGNGSRPNPVTDAEKKEYAAQKASGEYYWCNPPDRALGARPTTKTGQDKVDAYLWIKPPGEIDGPCRGAINDYGNLWIDYAVGLSQRAKW